MHVAAFVGQGSCTSGGRRNAVVHDRLALQQNMVSPIVPSTLGGVRTVRPAAGVQPAPMSEVALVYPSQVPSFPTSDPAARSFSSAASASSKKP